MSWSEALQLLDLLTRLLGGISVIIVFVISRTMVTKNLLDRRVKPIEDRLNRGDTAFEVMRTEEKHRPSRDDIDSFRRDLGMVNLSVAECTIEMRGLKERFGKTEHEVEMLVRLNLNDGRGA